MLVARKGLGGHAGYYRSRNCLEVLESLGASDPAKRWERAAFLRDVDYLDASELLHLGYEVKDLLKAGYEDSDFAGQEGLTVNELARAKEAIRLESRRRDSRRLVARALSLGTPKRSTSKVEPSDG